jgi:hypothetical protein
MAAIYAVTGIGYASRRAPGMKMLGSNFAVSRPGFLTEQLTTSSVAGHGGPLVDQSVVG